MMQWRRYLNRDYALLLLGAVAVLVVVWLVLAPWTFPVSLAFVEPLADDGTAEQVGIALAVFVVVIAAIRLIRTTAVSLDRSPIVDRPPESVTTSRITKATAPLDSSYEGIFIRLENPNRTERHAAMYGRRAVHTTGLSGELGRFLDELAVTARDVYATGHGCDEATAWRAITEGAWTDDRVAAAFLASDPDRAPAFTTRERLFAWFTPRRTFEARLDRVVAAIEEEGDVYLTYSPEGDR